MKVKAKTHEQFIAEMEKINPNIKVLGIYVNYKTKIEVMCKICGHIWKGTPNHLLGGRGCSECSKEKQRLSVFDEFIIQLYEKHEGRVVYVSGFKTKHQKCKFLCLICGHLWTAYPCNVLKSDYGCPKCGHHGCSEKRMFPLTEMLKRLKEVYGDSIIYVSGYDGMAKKCKWKCAKCGKEWEATPNSVINAHHGCVLCVVSTMEKPVIEALAKKNIIPVHNQPLKGCIYKTDTCPLRPDFLIERFDGKLWIECDGRQHFVDIHNNQIRFQEDQERDAIKNQYAKEHGYILIRVTSSPTKKWGTEKHITLKQLLKLIEIGIDSETGKINFELFRQYDFNRE